MQNRMPIIFQTMAATALLLALAACGGGGGAAPLPPTSTEPPGGQLANAAVDAYVQAELQRQTIPGMALVVRKNGRVVYAKGYGYSSMEKQTPATTEQRFQIGSISKQFMGAAVMLLVEDGKIELDEKIGKYLGAVPAEWDTITVRHLLAHTSGLVKDPDIAALSTDRVYTSDDVLTLMRQYKPLTEPGQTYLYSNIGYMLMGVIVEKITGAFYGDLIQNRIFTPLGMTTARIIDSGNTSATGYVIKDGGLRPVIMSAMAGSYKSLVRTGAGGIEMSASDLAKWDESLSTEKVLKQSSIAQMWTQSALIEKHTDYTIGYGLGWFLSDYRNHPKVYHAGGMYSFTTDYLRYTNDQLSVIVLTNLGGSNPEPMSRTIGEMFVPGTWPPK
jgi:D-alanyl-D-alanine carboxypeptidase